MGWDLGKGTGKPRVFHVFFCFNMILPFFFYMVVPLHSKLFIFSWNSEIWMVKLSRDEF